MKFRVPLPLTSRWDREFHLTVIEGPALAALCIALAAGLAVATDLGSNADISYYSTVAQVIPVFLLALMIEITSRLNRHFHFARTALEKNQLRLDELGEWEKKLRAAEGSGDAVDQATKMLRDLSEQSRSLADELRESLPGVRRVVRGYVTVAVPGEAASLVALAAGAGTTFEVSLGALSLVAMVVLYIRSLGSHYELD